MDAVAEIKQLYYGATKATIQRDVERAIDLLKTLPGDDDRERAAVYMDGLSQMRSEWSASARPQAGERRREHADAAPGRAGGKQAARGGVASAGSTTAASGPRGARPPARSGPSTAASRRPR
mgnify:CR=1 FL=1